MKKLRPSSEPLKVRISSKRSPLLPFILQLAEQPGGGGCMESNRLLPFRATAPGGGGCSANCRMNGTRGDLFDDILTLRGSLEGRSFFKPKAF